MTTKPLRRSPGNQAFRPLEEGGCPLVKRTVERLRAPDEKCASHRLLDRDGGSAPPKSGSLLWSCRLTFFRGMPIDWNSALRRAV